MRHLTLDDSLTLLSAREDPVGIISKLDRAVIDEIQRANWIDHAFAGKILHEGVNQTPERSLAQRVLKGGYPEAISRTSAQRRQAWATQYLEAITQRDVCDFAGIHKLHELPRFLRALAQTSGQMCNYAKLGGEVGLDGKTAAKYINIFEQMYLLKRVNVWASN